MDGARAVIVNVTGGSNLSMIEVSEATSIIYEAAHEEANIIFGTVIDPSMQDRVKVTVIATGFGQPRIGMRPKSASVLTPVDLNNYTEWQLNPPTSRSVGDDVLIARRSVVGLPALPMARAPHEGDERLNFDTSLEIPAFLRRPGR